RGVAGSVCVGEGETAEGETHAFAYDLAAANPQMVDLGTLGGGFSDATAIDDGTVVGESALPEAGSHAFAYHLGAASPHMIDLGSLGGESTAVDVDNDVV